MTTPDWLSLHFDGNDLPIAEPGVDPLTVGDRTRNSQIAFLVNCRQVAFRGQLILPTHAAVFAIEGCDYEEDLGAGVVLTPRAAQWTFAGCGRFGTLHERRMRARPKRPGANLRCDKHHVTPHDRSRYTQASQRCLPGDVRRTAPLRRQSSFRGYAGPQRTAPLRPVLGVE